jgi:outer membrane protein OmpA-like peptidoglycan-associated protein/tetratricopeptide (TPR) repeat protein
MRFLISISVFLFWGGNTVIAQNTSFRKADHEFSQMRYRSAIQYYEKGLKSDSLNIQGIERLAKSYENIRDYKNAEKWFSKAIDLNSGNVNNYLHYAEALASNSNYKSSAYWYQKLGESGDVRAAKFSKKYSENMNEFYADSNQWKITFTSLNTTFDEFSPVFFKQGLMFSSNREFSIRNKYISGWDFKPFIDLYTIDNSEFKLLDEEAIRSSNEGASINQLRDNRSVGDFGVRGLNGSGVYSFNKKPAKVTRIHGALKTKFHDGPVSLPLDEKSIMFTRNNFYKGTERLSREGVNKLKLYSARFIKGEWKDIQEFEYNSNEYSTAHPALSADGNILYFSSDMPGGMGGMDLYYSIKQNDKWGRPVNLGRGVNTKGDEVFPYLRDTGELYFSSTGLPGLGGLDIFKVVLDKFIPSKDPVNIGYPVNSEKDDFGIVYRPKLQSGFFSSNRKGNDDIYGFEQNHVAPASNDKSQLIAIKSGDQKSSKLAAVRRVTVEVNTIPSSETVSRSIDNPFISSRFTEVECLELRKKIQIGKVYYNSDQYSLRSSETPTLNRVIKLMNEYPYLQVKVSSHTDATASYSYNDKLSKYRSMVVKGHLMKHGIAEERISVESFGERHLLIPCTKDHCVANQSLNRRTEFRLLYKGTPFILDCK